MRNIYGKLTQWNWKKRLKEVVAILRMWEFSGCIKLLYNATKYIIADPPSKRRN